MNKRINMKMTKRYEKAFKIIINEDKKLAAEIIKHVELLEKDKLEQLNLDYIKRSKPKYKIMEIIIKSPQSYRVFYVYLTISGTDILLVDGRRKKVDRFSSDYFKELDKVIDVYISENY